MTAGLRPLPAAKVIRVLGKLGFVGVRQKGSHLVMNHPDGRITVVPVHPGEDIGRGLLRKILRDAEITPEEFLKLM